MEGLLVALLGSGLVFLGLGIYFGWMRKPKEEEEEVEEQVKEEKKTPEKQITFVYVDDDEKTKE